MIITEILNDGSLIKHYSDQGFMLLQNETGLKYFEPVDINPCPYTYIETDELAEQEEYRDGYRIIPEIITTTTMFALDECGWWGDILYKSKLDTNVYTPAQYAAGWEVVKD